MTWAGVRIELDALIKHTQPSKQEWFIAQRIIVGGIVAVTKKQGISSITASTINTTADASPALKIEPL